MQKRLSFLAALLASLLLTVPAAARFALPFMDDFTGSVGAPSAAWTSVGSGSFILSGSGRLDLSSNIALYLITGETFSADHKMQSEVYFLAADRQPGVVVRGDSTGGGRGYFLAPFGGELRLWEFHSGGTAGNMLWSTSGGVTGDVLKLEAEGSSPTVLRAYNNGTLLHTENDSTYNYTTGIPGLICYDFSEFDNALADDIGGGGGPTGSGGGLLLLRVGGGYVH